ncbi:MAG: septum formation initiator family protein [Candidatus Peribacteraceae bacterium]|nr:septum formation initiator family protein [Candidatus Peribacteraceae bacterium]
MAYQHFEPISKQLTIIVGLTVVGFMAFGLALSFYRNVLFEQTLDEIRTQNNALKGKIAQGYRDLEYYRSAQYKDKYAKENLGMVKPDEKVLIITDKPQTDPLVAEPNDSLSDQREAAYLELLRQMPVIEHWKLYFFYRDKIEELKKSL